MVYYDTNRMIVDLNNILESIPNTWDRNFIRSIMDSQTVSFVSMPQYNKVLDLYNKYIVVPAGMLQVKRDNNY